MIRPSTVKFLSELSKNNDREWFQANKRAFNAAQDNVTAFVGYLIGEVGKFDSAVANVDPKSCIFRIYRDVRFSNDKSPYKTHLGAYLAPGGRRSMDPGYYFHLEPGDTFIAGGKHAADAAECLKIRNSINEHTDEFLTIVNKKSYATAFGKMFGESLKTAPKGFDPEHKAIDYLKLKEFMAYKELKSDAIVTSPDFPKQLVNLMKEMYPLIAFLRRALNA